jgi:predicted ATP-dependent serine protease
MQNVRTMRFTNPATGREVGYWSAKYLGIIPEELLAQEVPTRRGRNAVATAPQEPVDVKTVKMRDLSFDPRLFVPILTNNEYLDSFLSSDGGFMPATNIVMIGGPGVGKSTIGMDLVARVAMNGKRVLFVSGEMNAIELNRYCKRFPHFAELDILFLGDYINSSPQLALEAALKQGYDMVLVDSFAEVCITVKEGNGWTQSKAESWLLDLMDTNNKGNNDPNLFTSFLVIQQVTKGGVFVGSNRIKHMTSGMLHLVRDRRSDTTTMEFSKNRVGAVGEELSYSIGRDYITYSAPQVTDLPEDEDEEEESQRQVYLVSGDK